MEAAGLIFSNIHDKCVPEMTRQRTIASVPFASRYRLIDFALSNMVNSGITKVGVITHNNYQSLLDHIGTGKDWDLARRSGGIKILPPFITAYSNSGAAKLYTTRLEALMGALNFINRCNEDYIVLSDCDVICNIDLNEVLEYHKNTNADVTLVTTVVEPGLHALTENVTVVKADSEGRLVDIKDYKPVNKKVEICTNITIVGREYLKSIVNDAIARGYSSFSKDVLSKNLKKANFRVFRYTGYYALIGSLESYFESSMNLLKPEAREGLFAVKNRPILTKVRNSPPTKYGENAKVVNSFVADGCVIEGEVENSILFRGVKIGKGTVVKNSIMFQDSFTGENVTLNCVITDKNVIIKDGRTLSGHSSMPFYISKGLMV